MCLPPPSPPQERVPSVGLLYCIPKPQPDTQVSNTVLEQQKEGFSITSLWVVLNSVLVMRLPDKHQPLHMHLCNQKFR